VSDLDGSEWLSRLVPSGLTERFRVSDLDGSEWLNRAVPSGLTERCGERAMSNEQRVKSRDETCGGGTLLTANY
jgi:hypothetical protein